MKAQNTVQATTQQEVESTTAPKLSIVKFHSAKISCTILEDGKVMVAIKPICDAIGIDSKHALLAIKKDSILGSMVGEYTLLDASNRKFPMQCIPIEYLHGWLFNINEKMVKATAKAKLIQFKKECYQVLFEHFYGKYRLYEENLRQRRYLQNHLNELLESRKELNKQITAATKQISELQYNELAGQYQLNIKGGNN